MCMFCRSLVLFSLKDVFVENHVLLSGINSVPYSINQPLNFVESKIQMCGANTMVQ